MKKKIVLSLILILSITTVFTLGFTNTGKVSEIDDGKELSGGSEKRKMFKEIVPIGSKAADFSLELLDGGTITLESLKGKIVVIVTGARTCPIFLIWANPMDELYKAYQGRDDVEFLYLYTREPYAGAIPGYGWTYRDVSQPATYEERKKYASIARDENKIDIPMMIDTMDGAVQKAYGNMPNGAVIIDRNGVIAAHKQWNDPLFVELALRDMVDDPPEVKQVETMLSCMQCHDDRVSEIDEDPEYNCASCHSMQKARRGLTNRMDRSHRKTSCDASCHKLNNEPPRFDHPGQTGSMRDLFIGVPPLYEEPGLSFSHLPHMNSGRFAYLMNFHTVSYKTKFGSCFICHSTRPLMSLKEEQCAKCHGDNPHKFHGLHEDEMGCLDCHTTPGKARTD